MPSARLTQEQIDRYAAMAVERGGTDRGALMPPPEPPPPVDDAKDEEEFRGQVEACAKSTGWTTYHVYNSRKSNAGWPDEVFVRGPVIFFAELKTETGRTTADQERWIELLRGAGQTVYLWRPSDWPDIRRILA
jgi:hypothetical protein